MLSVGDAGHHSAAVARGASLGFGHAFRWGYIQCLKRNTFIEDIYKSFTLHATSPFVCELLGQVLYMYMSQKTIVIFDDSQSRAAKFIKTGEISV